jgi:hypothetical protein
MRYIYIIIKADYLQRTRSYAFLITLAVTIYVAYLFVPPANANYTTLSTVGYRGAYNSAWVGYISAMMTTVMLSLYGFLLVNSGIKKDIDTEVGLIIATTPITNFKYLLSKQLSNYLVLLTIAGFTFVVSLLMFYLRGTGYPFVFADFIFPYVVFALPALFLVASLAIVAEVFLGKRSILQFIIYFFMCGSILAVASSQKANSLSGLSDPFGLSLMTNSIKSQINTQFHENIGQVSFGFIFNSHKTFKTFIWEGINWNDLFLLSRLFWFSLGLGLVYFSSFFFHRFDFKQAAGKKKKTVINDQQQNGLNITPAGISRTLMPPISIDYSIFPFIKIELLLLIRKGNKWLWLVNGGLWLSMLFAPLPIAHIYLLPVLWFLQVTRWSELATKEKANRLHYFTYASYKPLFRMLPAQILAGIILAIALALPVILRYAIALDGYSVINIINGSVLIVLLAVCLGIVSGGKKLFEIVFFMLTYSILNKIPLLDYLGSIPHNNRLGYTVIVLSANVFLMLISFLTRRYQARHL